MRRTKIVCTIGPASESTAKVQELLAAGMDVARLNFSHGTHEEHGARIAVLKEAAEKIGKHLALILDTKGPEIRTGIVPDPGVELVDGSGYVLDTNLTQAGNAERVGITYTNLWREVKAGEHILIDDGQLDLEVVSAQDSVIKTVIRHGGILKSQKGVNVPESPIELPAVTERDIDDIRFGIEQGVDFIAASFTRKAEDIFAVRRILEDNGAPIKIIAKIESREGIKNLDAILEAADGLMVARGDLGVEIPVEEVPLYQKEMIHKCNLQGKPVIVATQMLDSMIRQPRPTRAEASDVANAILDGADAVMLSGETAAGRFPVEAVRMMDKIARKTEGAHWQNRSSRHPQLNVAEAISYASYTIAEDLEAAAILTPTQSGLTPRMISKYRPKAVVLGATPFPRVARQLSLQWGVYPLLVSQSSGTDQLLSISLNAAMEKNWVRSGDVVVVTAGVPVGKAGTTNMVKVQVVGNVLAKGVGLGRKAYSAKARLVVDPQDDFADGEILVTKMTDATLIPLIAKAGAVVVEEGGLTSHAAIAALQYGIPAIVGAKGILRAVKSGEPLTVDALAGVVYEGTVSIL
ncbi:pyruvate kinase [Acididesulfobacillus acetoxydans]|uniref:Pyruvate kinase n=1 Tax=Acididesulfobacillus acetoxydans TaxID=1561005 RepID=A0A8S0WZE6_9FIRM|nr:pyruvate kinase [Acididesulfobacillus acetoxydans]CAA7601921.1 pyruvate kinase [Acididesulfobacillus acetoxydans]CEJ08235.1 Pyruvate kinase [Acididesulfobacillus acetoxydans]